MKTINLSDEDVNRLAQLFYEASGITLPSMTDKPKIVAGLNAVFEKINEMQDESSISVEEMLAKTSAKLREVTAQRDRLEEQFNRPQDFGDLCSISSLQTSIHQTAVEHGWWEPQETTVFENDDTGDTYTARAQRSFGDQVALMHSELSEALEAFREFGLETWYKHAEDCNTDEITDSPSGCSCNCNAKPEGAFVELADCIIRILDTAGYYGVDMESLLIEKAKYNESRSYRHGGKKL